MAVRLAEAVLHTSALAASVLLLAGCTTATPIPPGITDAEASAVALQQQAEVWSHASYSQGVAFPDIAPVQLVTRDTWASMQVDCLLAAGLPAHEISGGYAVDGDGSLSPADSSIAQATCLAQYPVDPRTSGYLSDLQLLYVYDFFTQRLGPCIALLGYAITPPPDRLAYVGSVRAGIVWTPYERSDGGPQATTAEGWDLINSRCPPLPADPFASFQPPDYG